ncbi:hypothetical protein BG015_011797 [Linnemannia schmuckeri]|uniref:Uncharacterized protein n=1 Tax=Linnemannia schmuckeri TaxID=64567 RepID=A0A9P5S4R6_9FUNG|nr:hypothetical protein BG015_011797 [Linnemannia schmuckeri]
MLGYVVLSFTLNLPTTFTYIFIRPSILALANGRIGKSGGSHQCLNSARTNICAATSADVPVSDGKVPKVDKGDRLHAICVPESSRGSTIFIVIFASTQDPSRICARIATRLLREQTPSADITRWKMIAGKF